MSVTVLFARSKTTETVILPEMKAGDGVFICVILNHGSAAGMQTSGRIQRLEMKQIRLIQISVVPLRHGIKVHVSPKVAGLKYGLCCVVCMLNFATWCSWVARLMTFSSFAAFVK